MRTPFSTIAASLTALLLVAGCAAFEAFPSEVAWCPVTVVNHLLPVEAGGAPEEIVLEPPYVAEMGWRYGGADRLPLADVRISGAGWGEAAVHFELLDPTGEVQTGNILSDDFRRGSVIRSLSTVGTWRYHLRALDDQVECERTIAIEVVPDSKRRPIDP